MKNFYEIAEAVTEKNLAEKCGLVIVQGVLECRTNDSNRRTYERGEVKAYRNKEITCIISTLDECLDRNCFEEITEGIITKKFSGILDAYRDIYKINFIYDALKFYYLALTGRNAEEKIKSIASLLSTSMISSALEHENIQEYELRKEDIRKREYLNFIASLKKGLKKQFRIVFD